jgi:uncharacterized protein
MKKNTFSYQLIQKYISQNTELYGLYIQHAHQVATKATEIALNLDLRNKQINFIYNASLLHDIGVFKVNEPSLNCFGDKPYIQHTIEGFHILTAEKLPDYAEVALKHNSPGLTKENIIKNQIPLNVQYAYTPETIEQQIIAYSDLFFTKNPQFIHKEKTFAQVLKYYHHYGNRAVEEIKQWHQKFEGEK